MGIWVPWLADAARMTGYPVVEVGGWRGRGHGGMRVVEIVVPHHTADGPTGDYPSLRIVRDGRAGLSGPLSQFGLGRTGTIFVIAAGQSWHAGASAWAGFWDLNDEAIGIEAESVGTRDDWTAAQRDCYPRLCAALLHFMRRGADRIGAHKEVCRPRGRKIDPAYWHMGGMRDQVGRYLADPRSINRHWRPGPPPPPPARAQRLTEDHTMLITTGPDETRWVSYFFEPGTLDRITLGWGSPGRLHDAKWWVRRHGWDKGRGVEEIDLAKYAHGGNQPHHMALSWGVLDDADCLEIAVTAPGQGLHIVGTPR